MGHSIIVHNIFKNEHYIPLAFCLLADKRQTAYDTLFVLLANKCKNSGLHLNTKKVVADFEKAFHNSLRSVWQETELVVCRFHFGQAWFRKIQNLGLNPHNIESSKRIEYTFNMIIW